jgi:chromosome segregation ATPase
MQRSWSWPQLGYLEPKGDEDERCQEEIVKVLHDELWDCKKQSKVKDAKIQQLEWENKNLNIKNKELVWKSKGHCEEMTILNNEKNELKFEIEELESLLASSEKKLGEVENEKQALYQNL